MPCVMRWPGKVPAGKVCDELLSTMDLLPTLAALAGARLPTQPIDGHDVGPILFGDPGRGRPGMRKDSCFTSWSSCRPCGRAPGSCTCRSTQSSSISHGRRPRHVSSCTTSGTTWAKPARPPAEHPEVVRRLIALADRARRELGDMDRPGEAQRPAGRVENPRPLTQPPTLMP